MSDDLQRMTETLRLALFNDLCQRYGKTTVSDRDIYEEVLLSTRESLLGVVSDQAIKNLPREKQHALINGLAFNLLPDDNLAVEPSDGTPVWLRVVPVEKGSLPSPSRGVTSRWIRLDTITEVSSSAGIDMGGDPEDTVNVVCVVAAGQAYHPTTNRYRGSTVDRPVKRLLELTRRTLRDHG
ncbi:hypothetical protein F6X37_07415 [Paraburkholderia sp. 31.1]|uniref:hypothetical protein n=1 Tax=Paraburkholderia sp. 31.1 TaxID=2615205 RepID=UPI001654E596|nr:hypothetical protein [Paraburkholderia sp. 31.1]MBC8721424.1 hypothetical protein [Paraburkholderia sp. 31.1]